MQNIGVKLMYNRLFCKLVGASYFFQYEISIVGTTTNF